MNSAWDDLNSLLDAVDVVDTVSVDASTDNIDEVRAVVIEPYCAPPYKPLEVVAPPFDNSRNVLNEASADAFKNELLFQGLALFTEPINTTNTMGGFVSNIQFHEKDLIGKLATDESIVQIRCNFGVVSTPNYTPTAAARKKKEKTPKKERKKQGTGTDFNSQCTFVCRGDVTGGASAPIYKFKVFRNGKIQLPGVKQHLIDEVIDSAGSIVRALDKSMCVRGDDGEPVFVPMEARPQLVNINPIMKNYKFVVRMEPGKIINLRLLHRIMTDLRRDPKYAGPKIFTVKYGSSETVLSIKFNTPEINNKKKTVRFKLFMRGKVNILGALDPVRTTEICIFLHNIFQNNAGLIVACGDYKVAAKFEQNIDCDDVSADEIACFYDAILNPPIFTEVPNGMAEILALLMSAGKRAI